MYLEQVQRKFSAVHSGPFIQAQAIVFFEQLQTLDIIPANSLFEASNGWLSGFKKR